VRRSAAEDALPTACYSFDRVAIAPLPGQWAAYGPSLYSSLSGDFESIQISSLREL
jgi:hypothetical protein